MRLNREREKGSLAGLPLLEAWYKCKKSTDWPHWIRNSESIKIGDRSCKTNASYQTMSQKHCLSSCKKIGQKTLERNNFFVISSILPLVGRNFRNYAVSIDVAHFIVTASFLKPRQITSLEIISDTLLCKGKNPRCKIPKWFLISSKLSNIVLKTLTNKVETLLSSKNSTKLPFEVVSTFDVRFW